jgi:hypothetical protein
MSELAVGALGEGWTLQVFAFEFSANVAKGKIAHDQMQ